MTQNNKIIYTAIDEAPALATHALLPVLQAFTRGTGIEFETRDISLSGRIIAAFPENLSADQRISDDLAYLGELVKKPEANIIKLPNISASVVQLKAALKELQARGYKLPDYPDEANTPAEQELRKRFAAVLGSAVNPVLREGNSDRRAAASVKSYAQKNPHRMMKEWPADSKSHVASMQEGDFFSTEKSTTINEAGEFKIEFVAKNGQSKILKEKSPLKKGEIIDTAVMKAAALRAYYAREIEDARSKGLLLSLHLKATMMKVSDPKIFGHCVSVYFKDVFEKHAATFAELGVDPDNALVDLYARIQKLPEQKRKEIESDIQAVYEKGPALAMVDSDKGITNLHATNDVIVDASMPVVVRDGGRMWNAAGKLQDTKALIPDRSYATMYQAIIEDCQKNGALNPATMGSVPNVGLMAQKAEEYGSHDKTFRAEGAGSMRVLDGSGQVLLEQIVEEGDIFRMCQAKDEPIKDWVKLAVTRARLTKTPAIFWLDHTRAHDAEIIKKVEAYLKQYDTAGLEIKIMPPADAMRYSLARVRQGQDAISVTGNVLRDYLTDLFPILELGTSARMLSIVPLLNGGGLFETGAGGSAPKHVQQFLKENHLRWDSLGEYCALVASLEHLAETTGNAAARVLASTLDQGIGKFLEAGRSPSRKVGELDNRGSTFYLTLYWARALASQFEDRALQERFHSVAAELEKNENAIVSELNAVQGPAVDIGGYYKPDATKCDQAMRPSKTLNSIIDKMLS